MDLQDRIIEIIAKVKSGNVSDHEQTLLKEWLADPKNKEIYTKFQLLNFDLTLNENSYQEEKILHNILYGSKGRTIFSNRVKWVTSIAASVLLLISLSYIFYSIGLRNTSNSQVEIIVPRGVRSSIILPDSTKVFLNSGSIFKYPTNFSDKKREVELQGEAYFEVSPDKKRTFIVHTSTVRVQVLGTHFNVRSYPDEKFTETSLKEGSVLVSNLSETDPVNVLLKPGKQAVYYATTRKFKIHNIDTEHISAWKYGQYYFESQTFEEIVKVLQRAFNVNISIKSEKLKKEVFTGDFVRGENIYQILEIIKQNTPLSYTFKDQTITITEN